MSLTKYHYVVASLTMEAAGRVMGLVEAVPPGGEPYTVLKDALLSAFSLSDYQRAEAIYSLPPLGDRRPSQLLAQIKSLMPSKHTDCLFIRHAREEPCGWTSGAASAPALGNGRAGGRN